MSRSEANKQVLQDTQEIQGKTKDAIELFTQLKTKFPASVKVGSGDVDRYLAKLGVTE